MNLKIRYLGYFNDTEIVNKYLENSEIFFAGLPDVCPFCGWIGSEPLHHGYTEDWICPILWLARNIREFRGARTITFDD